MVNKWFLTEEPSTCTHWVGSLFADHVREAQQGPDLRQQSHPMEHSFYVCANGSGVLPKLHQDTRESPTSAEQ